MFPAALMLIAILILKPPRDRLGRRHAAIALACFCLTAAPLVLSLSYQKHRFTFGDSGKLNYAWFVNGIPPYAGWTGQPAESGTPAHAPRKLRESPLVLDFRTPVSGTLPIWYDPSYWWEGVRAPVSVRRQWMALFRPFKQVHSRETIVLVLAAALAPLCLLSFRVRQAIRGGGSQAWILIGWPVAVCLMHSLLLFTYRFVIGYLVLACLGMVTLFLRPFQAATRTRALFAAALLLALAGTARFRPILQAALHPDNGGPLMREEDRDNGPSSAAVARELARLGIRPGDEIGALGRDLDCYYARLAGVRIVADLGGPGPDSGLERPRGWPGPDPAQADRRQGAGVAIQARLCQRRRLDRGAADGCLRPHVVAGAAGTQTTGTEYSRTVRQSGASLTG